MTTISTTLPTSATSAIAGTSATVAKTPNSGLSQTATKLAAEAGVVATLGGGLSADSVTYSAAGLLNSFVQAGNPSSAEAGDGSSRATPQSVDQALVASLPSSATTSGIYSASGAIQNLTASNSTSSADWASVLKTNPQAARTVIGDSLAQGIIGTLSTSA